jgi:hypothetical protein
MMTHLDTVVAPASEAIDRPDQQALHLLDDPEVAALIAEVDAVLCAALTPVRCHRVRPTRAPVGWPVLWGTGPSLGRTSAPRPRRPTRPSD